MSTGAGGGDPEPSAGAARLAAQPASVPPEADRPIAIRARPGTPPTCRHPEAARTAPTRRIATTAPMSAQPAAITVSTWRVAPNNPATGPDSAHQPGIRLG
jgi:hypothetical protein